MIDYSAFPLPKPGKRKKPEVKKDGRLVLNSAKWQKQKREMWAELSENCGYDVRCHLCNARIICFADFEPDHIIPRGHGGGRRDDRRENLAPAHSWCNRERGSKRLNGKAGNVRS